MTSDAYELAALTLRYVFAGLMLLIVLRAARGALTDSRRAAKLRRLSPMTGLSGELVVLEGDQRARRGMRYPVIREGMIGSSRRADIRIRHSTVRRRHAYFQLTEDGLHVRTHAGARLRSGAGRMAKELVLADGDSLYVGSVKLLLVLSVPDMPRRRVQPERAEAVYDEEDALFHNGDWNETPELDWEQAPAGLRREGHFQPASGVSEARFRRPAEREADETFQRGAREDPEARFRRPEPVGAREDADAPDPGFDPGFDRTFDSRRSGRNQERGAFPDEDDPFDVFMDEPRGSAPGPRQRE